MHHTERGRFNLIADEGRKKIEVALAPNYGYAKIFSSPESGAAIRIDGNLQAGATPLLTGKLKSGEHTVTVSKDMYKAHTQTFTINDGETTDIIVNMTPNFGKLTINSYPESGASISINEQSTDKTTPYTQDKLQSGIYKITLRQEWYETRTEMIHIEDGEEKVMDMHLNPIFGNINITTEPESEIYIDGIRMGEGIYSGRLIAGLHTLEARLENHHPAQHKTEIRIGEEKEIVLKPDPKQGTLKIVTAPFESQIMLNGKNYGTTPQTIRELPEGKYKMELSKSGYENLIKEIEIKDNAVTEVNEKLSVIPSDDPESQLTADNEQTGTSTKVIREEKKEDRRSKNLDSDLTNEKTEKEISHRKDIGPGKVILMSAALPGLGLTRMSNGKPYWLLGVAGGACLASSVVFHYMAVSSYESYRNPVSVEQVNRDYDNAVMQRNLSVGFAISAASLWHGDLTITSIMAFKDRNDLGCKGKNRIYFGLKPGPMDGTPMLSLKYTF